MQNKKLLILLIIMLIIAAVSIGIYFIIQNNDEDETIDLISDNSTTVNSMDYVITGTNQHKCYDDMDEITCPSEGERYFGQDAQYAGNEPSYQDNGNGTITDLNTNLTWIKDAGEKVFYSDALDDAESFTYAGYDDWRIPTIKELYSLMDFSGIDDAMNGEGTKPFINDEIFAFEYGNTSEGERPIDSQWITSSIYQSTVMDGEECFFGVNFADGRIKCYPTRSGGNNGYFLRYVRGDSYGINDFINNNDGTVKDNASGLIWQQDDSQEGMDWETSMNYCENLELAGNKDWRLPNAKELQSIVDYNRSPEKTDSAAIDAVFQTSDIINEAEEKDYPMYWTSTTHVGATGGKNGVYVSFGRAMGFMNDAWIDVHGAGAQRSDPKSGDPEDYPSYLGPQGDVRRVFNYTRCVRSRAEFIEVNNVVSQSTTNTSNQIDEPIIQDEPDDRQAPPEAITICENKPEGSECSFVTTHKNFTGICNNTPEGELACVPE